MRLPIEAIARICHEANRAYALATGEDPSVVFPGWTEAPESIRQSAIIGVRRALAGEGPRALHESWCATKQADGWVYGKVKDLVAKIHPCLVPYDDLPVEQQRKDDLFAAIVKTLAHGA